MFAVAVVLFLIFSLGVGIWASKRISDAGDFYVAGRKLPFIVIVSTQIATAWGGGVMLAHTGIGYKWGFSTIIYDGSVAVGMLLVAFLVTSWLRRQDFYTLPDWLCSIYGEDRYIRGIGALIAMLVSFGWWVAQLLAGGKILATMAGMPNIMGVIITAVVVVAYTYMGGMMAVAYTDVLQFGLFLIGMFVLLPLGISNAGGLQQIFASVPKENLTLTAAGGNQILTWLLAVLPGQMTLQLYYQRIYAADSEKTAKNGLLVMAGSSVLVGLWASLLGMSVFAMNPALADREAAVPWFAMNMLPTWGGILTLVMVLAAMVSTADSSLHAMSTNIARDLYKQIFNPNISLEQELVVAKRTVLIMGIGGLAAAMLIPFILQALVAGYTLTASGLLFPLFLGHFWKRINKSGALAGMVGGVVVAGLFQWMPALKALPKPFTLPVVMGLLASLILTVGVSMFSEPRETQHSLPS